MSRRNTRYRSPDEKILDAWLWIIAACLIAVGLFITGAGWVIWQTLEALGLF